MNTKKPKPNLVAVYDLWPGNRAEPILTATAYMDQYHAIYEDNLLSLNSDLDEGFRTSNIWSGSTIMLDTTVANT